MEGFRTAVWICLSSDEGLRGPGWLWNLLLGREPRRDRDPSRRVQRVGGVWLGGKGNHTSIQLGQRLPSELCQTADYLTRRPERAEWNGVASVARRSVAVLAAVEPDARAANRKDNVC